VKIATWNVNSLRVRLPHLLDWLAANAPDAICLQETKCEDATFPADALREAGYHALHHGQRGYNGVAILSREPASEVRRGMPDFEDVQSRVIVADVAGIRLVSAYVPNGQAVGSEKFDYKLRWYGALRAWLAAELASVPQLAVLGDFNVAPEDRDVHDPAMWEGKVHVSPPEREALRAVLELGFVDAYRLHDAAPGAFTWWDYRLNAFRRGMGLRIDHVLLSPALAARCVACTIDLAPRRLERPSDHAPVVCELA
jgi:exodeoxyribonuclease III